jgi:hypothetical protein
METRENIPYSKLWWETLPGPSRLCDEICEGLQEKKHIIIEDAHQIPWKPELRDDYCNPRISSAYTNADIVLLDDKDIAADGSPIGNYLLNQSTCASVNVKSSYRASSGKTIERFLIENGVLKNKIYWVKDIHPKRMDEWIHFLTNFKGEGIHDGLFVLEHSAHDANHLSSNMKQVSFNELVHGYDYYTFCCQLTLRFSDVTSFIYHKYMSTLLFYLCETDTEIMIDILEQHIHTLVYKQPKDFLPFFHDQQIDEPAIISRIWKAQVQELFPILENSRIEFIEHYKSELEKAWNNPSCITIRENRIGEIRESIYDLEIADINYLMKSWFIRVPSENDRKKVELIYNSRNKLAHHSLCSPEDVSTILKWR